MALEGVATVISAVLKKLFGSRNERLVRRYRVIAEAISQWDEKLAGLADEDLPKKTAELRDRIKKGATVEEILPEAFALVRLASERAIGLRPYDVQFIGGQVLTEGKISEMATGEGKTLVATLPNYLHALFGPVHLVTVNDYLVRRDAMWMGPIYEKLGLTIGFIQTPMDSSERIPQYRCDITYGTNNEFGFDYLRDNMKISAAEQAQGDLNFVIVDEVDSVLVDEARTPLIISGPAFDSTEKYAVADEVVRKLKLGVDFEVKEKEHQVPMTEHGVKKAEQLVGRGSFYVAGNMEWPHLIEQSLRAHNVYRRDKEYVVQGDEVIIVDEFTGRLMPGRQWSDGLHQAVEAKERIRIKEETQTLATITFQNFFKLYKRLAGMTGTAMTEADELNKIYSLEVVAIPTNRPLNRMEHSDVVFMTLKEKFDAIVDEINTYSKRGRPVLVGTISIENSEKLSLALTRRHGLEHEVLSAKHHQREAEIVAGAGQRHEDRAGNICGNVTIATNMAGRGTDIKLGEGVVYKNCHGPWDVSKQRRPDDFGNKCCINCPEHDGTCAHCFKPKLDPAFPKRGRTECRENPPCGLHIVGTERHEARRIDNQLRGRAGRQGDPGSSRFFLSLQDDLMRIFAKDWVTNILKRMGLEEGMALEHGFLSRGIENAQKKVEEHNFHIRKNLLEYDEVMDRQRKIFYGRRQEILEADNLRAIIWEILTATLQKQLDTVLKPNYAYEAIADWARRAVDVTVKPTALQDRTSDEIETYLKDKSVDEVRARVAETLGEFVAGDEDEDEEEDLEAEAEERDRDEPEEPAAKGPKIDYRALAIWARERFALELKPADLQDQSVEQIQEMLQEVAEQKVRAVDCAAIAEFLDADYPLRVLTDWLRARFDLQAALSDLQGKQPDEIRERLLAELSKLYDRKEREYPIDSAIEEYLTPSARSASFNFAGLANWATWYYGVGVTEQDVRLENYQQTRDRLLAIAEVAEREQTLSKAIQKGLTRYLAEDSARPTEHNLPAIRTWASELGVELTAEELAPLTRAEIHELLARRAAEIRRGIMTNMERYLLLQVFDTSWKDHLYMMDHLKASVGLRGYAQVDPKLEFKREGFNQFETMLSGINEKFSDLFFKARSVQRHALNSIWSGQSAEHQEVTSDLSKFDAQRQAALEGLKSQTEEKPKPIVRSTARVGRNDPCPCGSGKKYKKCCGVNG